MVTRIQLIRHASTEPGGRLCGSFDVPLSLAGRAEVDALLRRLVRGTAPDALFTSTLRRTSDVAVALGREWALQPTPAEWAREIHCGEVEGMPLEQLQREFPDVWRRNLAQNDESFAWPGGESYREFRARILDGLQTTVTTYAGRRVTVVTHAGVISQVLGVIRQRRAAAWAADRAGPLSATEIVWENGAPGAILRFNDQEWD